MPQPLTRVPTAIVQGVSVAWTWSNGDYLPADGWGLVYAFEGPTDFNAVAVVDGDGFRVDLTTVQTAALLPGFYRWQAFVARSVPTTERELVGAGALEVCLDLLTSSATGQQKSFARRMVEAIQAQLEGRATDGQSSMSINGRAISRIPILELEQILTRFESRLRAEEAALAQGATPGKRRPVKVRF